MLKLSGYLPHVQTVYAVKFFWCGVSFLRVRINVDAAPMGIESPASILSLQYLLQYLLLLLHTNADTDLHV